GFVEGQGGGDRGAVVVEGALPGVGGDLCDGLGGGAVAVFLDLLADLGTLVHAFTHHVAGGADAASAGVVGLDQHPRIGVFALVLLVFVEGGGEVNDGAGGGAVGSHGPGEGGELKC